MKLIQTVGSSLAIILLISACGGLSKRNNSPTSSPVNETEDTNTTMSTSQKAMKRITEYAKNGGTAPTIQDYKDAGISGIDSEAKLAEINQVIERLEEKDVDTIKEVQAIVNSVSVEVSTDTKAPLITIIGGKTLAIKQNSIYSDAGATAVDDKDGNVTVTTTGSVDTATLGDYNLTYTATDSTGNIATAIRTVTVEVLPDTTLPVITILGDTNITVMQVSTYTDAGATALDDKDGNVTVSSISSVDTNISGDYNVTYTATDAAGNKVMALRVVRVKPVTMTHNGTTYGIVVSPHTGKVWLDRNLGAAQVCTSFDDQACYGDYYQWGRNFDGHQDSTSGTEKGLARNVNNIGDKFRIESSDWGKNVDSNGSIRSKNWSKTDGSSVCPIGFRVPKIEELSIELLDEGSAQIKNQVDAFKSFLKLPSAGSRFHMGGEIKHTGKRGRVWSITLAKPSLYSETASQNIDFMSDRARLSSEFRTDGFSVRCVRDLRD